MILKGATKEALLLDVQVTNRKWKDKSCSEEYESKEESFHRNVNRILNSKHNLTILLELNV